MAMIYGVNKTRFFEYLSRTCRVFGERNDGFSVFRTEVVFAF